jgi:hypothetical protein
MSSRKVAPTHWRSGSDSTLSGVMRVRIAASARAGVIKADDPVMMLL